MDTHDEGLSLQESLVSRLVVTFTKQDEMASIEANPEIALYRKKKTIVSRIVSVSISWPGTADYLSQGAEFKLSATQNKKDVAMPVSGDYVDPTSGLIKMKQGESIKVSLRLNEEAQEGTIQVKAINPVTEKTLDSLELNYIPLVD